MHDQTNISNDQTSLPMHRNRRPGSSSSQPHIFEMKHPLIFDLIFGNHDIPLWDAVTTPLVILADDIYLVHTDHYLQRDQDRYKKNRTDIPVAMKFGVVLIDNKNWFYKLSFKGQLLKNSIFSIWVLAVILLNDKHINVYDSYRAACHGVSIKTEVVKLAQLIPLKLTMNEYYKNRGILFNYDQQKNDVRAISDNEAPPQHIKNNVDFEDSETIQIE
ncbi:hypothetical protein R3W88_029574 [Solanum pinnatisectum]|uniref:Uncharacterized protein n=1 Tax=Solanum pinnatisectum TaxID=50273 RepID=A0AAV9K7R1_9SOLN|nr:hypothetical protein R3W88_029574 [Solanum pinnatisectum]